MATPEEATSETQIQVVEPAVEPSPRSIGSRVKSCFVCCASKTQIQVEEPAVELLPRSIGSRVKSCFMCCTSETQRQVEGRGVEPSLRSFGSRVKSFFMCYNVIGALGLGLVTGGSAGGCMAGMTTAMTKLIRDAVANYTMPTVQRSVDFADLAMFTSCVTYMCLAVATLSSVVGVVCGAQAYNLVRKQSQEAAPGKALALAAPVAVLGVAVTGAAVGAVLEKVFFLKYFLYILFACYVAQLLLCLVSTYCIYLPFMCICSVPFSLLFYVMTGLVFFVDLAIMLPLVILAIMFSVSYVGNESHFSKVTLNVPTIMITTVLIARSLMRDEHHPVPLLDHSEANSYALVVLENAFVLVLGIQMFQVSCGAVLFSHFVTGGAFKVCTGAVAATATVLAFLLNASNKLGTGASLGALLAASGGAGVALNAAGDLGQKYGGHVGRAGAVLGAAVGAFLPFYLMEEVRFGIMVALCAAAIPGSYSVVEFMPILITWPWYVLLIIASIAVVAFLAYEYYKFRVMLLILVGIFGSAAERQRYF